VEARSTDSARSSGDAAPAGSISRSTDDETPASSRRLVSVPRRVEVYSAADADSATTAARLCDVGILQRDIDLPLPQSAWSWKVDALPSTLAEDTLPTHDYLSIAVEFSTASTSPTTGVGLAPHRYWCPLPTWAKRCGTQRHDRLGRWIDEDRTYTPTTPHIGEPQRIRRGGRIANSMFQRGGASAPTGDTLRSQEGGETCGSDGGWIAEDQR
jgi:hypothetical protein